MSVNRMQMMVASKIGSKTCYYRVLKDLHDWGFLEYCPPSSPREFAQISLKELKAGDSDTLLTAGIKYPKETDLISEHESDHETYPKAGRFYKTNKNKTKNNGLPPTPEEVCAYFKKQGLPLDQAMKFYYYFESIGWMQGGRTPIVNWMATADRWKWKKHPNKKRFRRNQDDADNPMDYGTPL